MSKTTFEQLCTGKTGYSCDEHSMVRLTKEETYNDLTFKLITKCETNLLFLPSPTCQLNQFTLDIVPNFSNASVDSAWRACERQNFDGLNVLAALDQTNIPMTSLTTYTFSQFINSIIHSVEAHFMFQRFNAFFGLNSLNLWNVAEEINMKSCAVVLCWKFNRKPMCLQDILSRSPLSQLNSSSIHEDEDYGSTVSARGNVKSKTPIPAKSHDKRRRTLLENEVSTPVTTGRRRRSSAVQPLAKQTIYDSTDDDDDDDNDDDDDEISFRKKPELVLPNVKYLKQGMTPRRVAEVAEPMETEAPVQEPIAMADLTLGFEKAQPKKGGRKSNARKSLMPDWPKGERDQILQFFDNLNPSKTEQTRVAHTCKFAHMQYDRDLPSKLLYQWIQQKGRPINKTIFSYEIPENEQYRATLDLYKELNPETSETSRVAFICKFVNLQYAITLTSKEFYDILNGKGKKTSKRR